MKGPQRGRGVAGGVAADDHIAGEGRHGHFIGDELALFITCDGRIEASSFNDPVVDRGQAGVGIGESAFENQACRDRPAVMPPGPLNTFRLPK